jgi:chromosomal replication initiation ATPase DnaA
MAVDTASGNIERMLVSGSIVTPEELKGAQDYAREHGVPLVQALIDTETLTQDEVAFLHADASQVRSLKLEDVEIDRESVRHVPAAAAYRHKMIPVRRSGNTLVVAMANPSDQGALAALRSVTDFEIVVFVARTDAIEHALHIHYGEPPQDLQGSADSGESAFEENVPMVSDERFAHIGRSIPLNRNFTFDGYVADAGCQYPLSLARTVVSGQPEDRSCPLVFWGPPGSGKSHLLHAIGNYLATREPLDKFILTTCPAFNDNLFDCIRRLKVNLFRYFYRDAKYLLLDDCEAMLGAPWAQSELADTIASIRGKGGWVVLCSNQDLMTDPRLTPRLRTILDSGQIAAFESYSPEGRARVLAHQIGRINIPVEALSRLSQGYRGDMKDLQELLRQFAAISVLESRELTEDVVEEMLSIHGCGRGNPA